MAGRLKRARALLAYDASASSWPKSVRWLNAAGLLLLLEHRITSAMAILRRATELPFGVSSLPAWVNLYWAAHLHPNSTMTTQLVDEAAEDVLRAFEQTRDHVGTLLDELSARGAATEEVAELFAPPRGGLAGAGASVFDLPIARAVCDHPLYDRHRERPDLWQGMDEATRWRRRYLDLLRRSLTRYLSRDLTEDVRGLKGTDADAVRAICEAEGTCEAAWHIGQGAQQPDGPWSQKWASGLVHLEVLLEDVAEQPVHGDIIEAGCYTAGTGVLLRAMLEYDPKLATRQQPESRRRDVDIGQGGGRGIGAQAARRLLLADSFEGIPLPRTARGRALDTSASWPERYVAGEAQARSTMRRYGMLDERVLFLRGLFNETLGKAPSKAFALIHIDADAYDSVLDALRALYPRLSSGGHVVVDDFHLPGVRAAVREFRRAHDVSEPLLPVPSDHVTTCTPDWTLDEALTVHPLHTVYWTRTKR